MKKMLSTILATMLFSVSVLSVSASNESEIIEGSFSIIVQDRTQSVPEEIIQQLIEENPDAGKIIIYEYGEVQENESSIEPRLIRGFSEVVKTYNAYDVLVEDVFVTSVAKGQTTTLQSDWSHTLGCEITGSIDSVSLGIKDSITKNFSTTVVFSGPLETSNYNSREYRVKFFENQGTYTALAHDDLPGWIIKVPISGTFTEPSKYASYSVDKNE